VKSEMHFQFADSHAHVEFCAGKLGADRTYIDFLRRLAGGKTLGERQNEARLLRRCSAVVIDWCRPDHIVGPERGTKNYAFGIDALAAAARDVERDIGLRLHFGLGVHPTAAEEWTNELHDILTRRLREPDEKLKRGLVCMGEMGLDYERREET
jgi:Tat protein secretion system quality control protein TatD with DNase activity